MVLLINTVLFFFLAKAPLCQLQTFDLLRDINDPRKNVSEFNTAKIVKIIKIHIYTQREEVMHLVND